jgi:hypothetical protein
MWIDGNQRVADVNHPHPTTLKAVATNEVAAWLEDPKHFLQDLVLLGWRRNVVEHGERDGARELGIPEGHIGRVTFHDLNIASVQSGAERTGQLRINFECGESRHCCSEKVGR